MWRNVPPLVHQQLVPQRAASYGTPRCVYGLHDSLIAPSLSCPELRRKPCVLVSCLSPYISMKPTRLAGNTDSSMQSTVQNRRERVVAEVIVPQTVKRPERSPQKTSPANLNAGGYTRMAIVHPPLPLAAGGPAAHPVGCNTTDTAHHGRQQPLLGQSQVSHPWPGVANGCNSGP